MQPKIVFAALCAVLFVTACTLPEPNKPTENKDVLASVVDTPKEILYHDVFKESAISTDITVLGISVGMSADEVATKLGQPDQTVESDFGGTIDYLYGKKLGLASTGVTYHSEKGTVTRIILSKAMAPLLHGGAQPGRDKAMVFTVHGTPDRQYDFSFTQSSRPQDSDAVSGRFLVYNKQGVEIYMTRGVEYQYALVYPGRKLPTMAFESTVLNPSDIVKVPPLPVLMTDTTTLCDQGKTSAYNPASTECTEYRNSCEIPDWWVEINDCSKRPPFVPRNETNMTNSTQ